MSSELVCRNKIRFNFSLYSFFPVSNHHLLPVRCMNENPLYLRHIYENPGRGTCPPQAQSGGDVSLHGIVQTQKKKRERDKIPIIMVNFVMGQSYSTVGL